MTESELFQTRQALLELFLRDHGYDGILLSRVDNFAMATGGKRNFIYTHGDLGSNSLFVTNRGKAYFVGNTIEEGRILEEELAPFDAGSLSHLWFDDSAASLVQREFSGNLVSDTGALGANVNHELGVLRALLTPAELEKYRRLGALAAEAMEAAAAAVEPGMTEADIAACLVAEGARRQCQVPVALVAADDRIARFRHPLPTTPPLLEGFFLQPRRVESYVMLVGCYLREGLVVSLTRFKKVVEALEPEIEEAFARICAVDALMQEATQPGRSLGDVFQACQEAYAALGFAENEWHNHHQGGATGYAGRTCKGSPGETFPVLDPGWADRVRELSGIDTSFGSAFAWNPSAPGVKSEDTFLLHPDGRREIVTSTPSFPAVNLERVLGRPVEAVKSGISA